jgi:hypothetical protein
MPAINGYEMDYLYWKHVLKLFRNWTGLGKKVKRTMAKRARQQGKRQAEEPTHAP